MYQFESDEPLAEGHPVLHRPFTMATARGKQRSRNEQALNEHDPISPCASMSLKDPRHPWRSLTVSAVVRGARAALGEQLVVVGVSISYYAGKGV